MRSFSATSGDNRKNEKRRKKRKRESGREKKEGGRRQRAFKEIRGWEKTPRMLANPEYKAQKENKKRH